MQKWGEKEVGVRGKDTEVGGSEEEKMQKWREKKEGNVQKWGE
jgi:hypothetical protein